MTNKTLFAGAANVAVALPAVERKIPSAPLLVIWLVPVAEAALVP